MQEYLDLSSAARAARTLIDILRGTTARYPQASALEDEWHPQWIPPGEEERRLEIVHFDWRKTSTGRS